MALQTIGPNDINTAYDFTINGLTVGKGTNGVAGNTALGLNALAGSNSGGGENTAIGLEALNANTTGADQVAVGYRALAANTTGTENVSIGSASLRNTTTGNYNVAVGRSALNQNTTASNNTAVGYQAGYSTTTNANSTFVGFNAGKPATGASNTIIGAYAGTGLTTGGYNTFIGALDSTSSYSSGSQITTGSKNTIIGSYSGNNGGLDIRTASNYIVLSDGDGNPRGVFDGSGNFLVGTTSTAHNANGFTVEGGGVPYVTRGSGGTFMGFYNLSNATIIGYISNNGGTATAYNTSSDYRLKENITPLINALNTVSLLKPCNYKWKSDGSDGEGFIAHELAEVLPQAVTGTKDAIDAEGNPVYQGIDTSFLVATLTAAIQELSAQVTTLQAQVTAQAARITALEAK